ncbi:PA2169 family four-helix-bundle protein [Ramlibacter sp. H39-3-26]|uniref:ferritin-like domain-containing protein n=1 Tax=Curvibacter soli TaxID=3031331 RepID=UPI0023DBF863|nr:PA2169 family four-helix-bundle protein [Ramlibacter sp. H39-3-26]MDF1485980.1 PA2169 family four-helix-bundle protein [Ramlibacter sp. H39-3-26]
MAKDTDLNLGPITREPGAHPVKPTVEDSYWRGVYASEPYYDASRTYDDYGPAYAFGWTSRTIYDEPFDAAEQRLAADWETHRAQSRLAWEDARLPARAAWDRVDARLAGGADAAVAGAVDDDEVIDTLNGLLESCRDGEYGFRHVAGHAKTADLRMFFERGAGECATAAGELQAEVTRLGGQADTGGTVAGALHRGWVSVRSALSAHDDLATLEEAERGEDAALARYRKALQQPLPAGVRALVQRQMQGAQRNHDEVKRRRDALRMPA